MGNRFEELSEEQIADITKLVKFMSDNIKTYFDNIGETTTSLDRDTALMSMQILSILCGLARNYPKSVIEDMWAASFKISSKIHASRSTDHASSKLQVPFISNTNLN